MAVERWCRRTFLLCHGSCGAVNFGMAQSANANQNHAESSTRVPANHLHTKVVSVVRVLRDIIEEIQ